MVNEKRRLKPPARPVDASEQVKRMLEQVQWAEQIAERLARREPPARDAAVDKQE